MFRSARITARSLWLSAAVLVVVAVAATLPMAAHAGPGATGGGAPGKPAPTVPAAPALAPVTHQGWTYLNLNYCAPGRACAAMHAYSTTAYRYTPSTGWRTVALPGGWVYVAAYTGNWRWAYTSQTGWVAISGGRFELR